MRQVAQISAEMECFGTLQHIEQSSGSPKEIKVYMNGVDWRFILYLTIDTLGMNAQTKYDAYVLNTLPDEWIFYLPAAESRDESILMLAYD